MDSDRFSTRHTVRSVTRDSRGDAALVEHKLLAHCKRLVVVVVDHGDETRYAGGFLASVLRRGVALTHLVVAVPVPRLPHRGWWTAARLRRTRPDEARFALALLGAGRAQRRQWQWSRTCLTHGEGAIAARLRRVVLASDLVVMACPPAVQGVFWHAGRWVCDSVGARLILFSGAGAGLMQGVPLEFPLADEDATRKRLALWAYRSRARPDPYSNAEAEWKPCAPSEFAGEAGRAWWRDAVTTAVTIVER